MIDLVVAHYNENLDWINTLEDCRVFIYSKGSVNAGVRLENVGREAHTYWHHILTVQDKSEYTAFLQGNPFEHTDHLLYRLSQRGMFNWISSWIISDNGYGQHHWVKLPIHQTCLDLLGYTLPDYMFGAGCQSIVHRDLLEPCDLYKKIYAKTYDLDFPWINERLWYYFVTASIKKN